MRYGRLDRKIDIQRKQVTTSPSGQPIETWVSLAARRWAYVAPVSGDERFTDPQLVSRQQVEFGIRYSADVADLSPLDRVVSPSVQETSPATPTPDGTIFDIVSVSEIGRREGLKIIAVRRADT